jgi:hypothetical protein
MSTVLDRPFVQGSRTSLAASCAAKDLAVDGRAKVFAAIHNAGIHGLTRQEIEVVTFMDGNTVRPRVAELLARDLIKASDEVRRSPTGRPCEVLISKTLVEDPMNPALTACMGH